MRAFKGAGNDRRRRGKKRFMILIIGGLRTLLGFSENWQQSTSRRFQKRKEEVTITRLAGGILLRSLYELGIAA